MILSAAIECIDDVNGIHDRRLYVGKSHFEAYQMASKLHGDKLIEVCNHFRDGFLSDSGDPIAKGEERTHFRTRIQAFNEALAGGQLEGRADLHTFIGDDGREYGLLDSSQIAYTPEMIEKANAIAIYHNKDWEKQKAANLRGEEEPVRMR